MTLIELGEVSSSGSEPDVPAVPPRRVDVRRIGVLLAAVLCVLTVTGSERPETRGLPILWQAPLAGQQFTLTADSLYAQGGGSDVELVAHDADDGDVQWRLPTGQPSYWVNADIPGLLLVPVFTEQEVADENGNKYMTPVVTHTLGLDTLTGRERWRAAGESSLWSGDLIMMTTWDERAAGTTRFRTVHTSDGSPGWELTLDRPASTWTAIGPDPRRPDRFVSATDDGTIEVRRFDTGVVVARKKVPWLPPNAQEGASVQVYGARSALLLIRQDAGKQVLEAYEPDTMNTRWTRTISVFQNFFDCGRLFCLSTGVGRVDALDPATGRIVWQGEGWDYAQDLRPGLMVTEPFQGGFHGLVDATTGRTMVEFSEGTTLIDRAGGRVFTLGPNMTPPGGAAVSQLIGDDTIIMRGLVGPVTDAGCQLAAGRLACGVPGGELAVMDVG